MCVFPNESRQLSSAARALAMLQVDQNQKKMMLCNIETADLTLHVRNNYARGAKPLRSRFVGRGVSKESRPNAAVPRDAS